MKVERGCLRNINKPCVSVWSMGLPSKMPFDLLDEYRSNHNAGYRNMPKALGSMSRFNTRSNSPRGFIDNQVA